MNWIFDIEIYQNFFLVNFLNIKTKEKSSFQISQRQDDKFELIKFLKKIAINDGQMVGFNNLQFDYPLLHWFILNFQKFKYNKELTLAIWKKAQELIKTQTAFFNIIKQPFIKQIDLFKIHHYDNPAKSNSLKHLEFNLRMDNIQDLPFPFDKLLEDSEQDIVKEYCWNDIEATYQFYLKSLYEIKLREDLTKEYGIDFTNYSASKIGEIIFIHEFEKTGRQVIPDTLKPMEIKSLLFSYIKFKEECFNKLLEWFQSKTITETKGVFSNIPVKELESLEGYYFKKLIKGKQKDLNIIYRGVKMVYGTGGIHGCTQTGIYESDDNYIIKTADVSSLYPNLSIQNKVYPTQLSEIFCNIYQSLYEKRKTFEKGTAMNLAIKLCLNSVYGKSNSKFSKLYSPSYTMTITINGQLLLTMLAEMLCEIPNSQFLMINTDGLEIKIPREYEQLYYDICKQWEFITKLELEFNDYQKMIIANVNNYIAISTNGKVKRKGAMFIYEIKDGELEYHKDHSSLVIQKALEQYFVYNKDPKQYIFAEANIYDFFKRVKLNKTAKLLKREIELIPLKIIGRSKKQKYQKNILSETILPKITRYYIAKEGYELVKILPPLSSKIDDRESYIEAGKEGNGELCVDCNILNPLILNDIQSNINYDWYYDKVINIITKIESNQEIEERFKVDKKINDFIRK